jgi:hypothetical protein
MRFQKSQPAGAATLVPPSALTEAKHEFLFLKLVFAHRGKYEHQLRG